MHLLNFTSFCSSHLLRMPPVAVSCEYMELEG